MILLPVLALTALVAADAPAGPAPAPGPATAGVSNAVAPGAAGPWEVPAFHALGLMAGMRLSIGLAWPSAYALDDWATHREQLRLAFTRPPEFDRSRGLLESDGDPWWLNGVGHALFGSEVYGRTRACGGDPWTSLLAAAAASTAWEYVVESPWQRPSAIDLAWTPLVGALLGEGRFRLQRWLRARDPRSWLLLVVDPLGELERRAFGTRC